MAAPSTPLCDWSYDVFLSFRGEDTRNTFTGHLYNALHGAGIYTFKDDEQLQTGEEIGPELLSAIEKSRIAIPIFSKTYASSKWCLNELVKIVECRKTLDQIVLPIFYDVNPKDVRNHTGSYGEAFWEHSKSFDQTTIEGWKGALTEVGNLKGWDLKEIANGHEGTLVKFVVAEVSSKLRKDTQIVSDDLVGIQFHVEKMMSLLNITSKDIKIVGIQGLGGIGKTTIAKVIYNTISHNFEGCSFLANVRETSQHYRGLVDLQYQLISNVLKGANCNITDVCEGINVIRQRLCRKKVLIILDDVDDKIQLDSLINKHDWFGLGSRIIITTRNGQILANHGVDEIYEPNEMDANHSLQLFSRHAFKSDQPLDDYLDISKDIVNYTGGLPLALEVIGSSLFDMKKPAWQDTLKILKDDSLHGKVMDKVLEKLRISFDGLRDSEKEIFLDVACFFQGMDKDIACFIWQQGQRNFYPGRGVDVLCQKSLVKIGENNELKMHDLLRDLGKEIICQENLKVPGGRSRLWSQKEALDVLNKHMGTDKVEGLCIDFFGCSRSQRCLTSEGFAKMTNLSLLQVDYAHFAPDFAPSFSELIWLRWKGCPQEFTLTKFHPVNLVVLDLSYSLFKNNWMGWNYIKIAKNLKVLNLAGCQYLLRTPELNLRLEVLILENCESLVEIDESIIYLERLVTLNMRGCTKLRDLPYGIWDLTSLKNLNLHQCEVLDKLPDSIGFLKNLETLDASFCYIKNGRIPDTIEWLSSLKILRLGGNNFHSLPVAVSSLSLLQTLDLRFCYLLESLPELPSSLKYFNVMRCSSLKSLPRLSNLTNLEELYLDDCQNLVEMPALLGLRNLEILSLDNCESLVDIEGLEVLDSLQLLTMKNCGALRKIGKISSVRKLKELRLMDYSMLSEIEGLEGLDSLELLRIKECTLLRKIPELSELKKLRVLKMECCKKLLKIEGLVGLDSLEQLTIKGCTSLIELPELSYLKKLLTIKGCTSLIELPELSYLKKLRVLEMECLNMSEIKGFEELVSLELLTIKSCPSLIKIPKLSALKKLGTLEILDCKTLHGIEGLDELRSLEKLRLIDCPLIKSLPDLSNLKKLTEIKVRLGHFVNITKIQGLNSFISLEILDICRCMMERLPGPSIWRNLKHLSTVQWFNLKEIQGLNRMESLETLDLNDCISMERLPDLSNLKNLKHLSTAGCIILKKIQGLNVLESLETLNLNDCISMEILPDLSNLRNLKHLFTAGCINLKKIRGLDVLESLETLEFNNCRSMERLPDLSNLRNLKHLATAGCINLRKIQGLSELEYLETLDFNNCRSMGRLPDLSNLRNLKHLSTAGSVNLKEIQHLVRLKFLERLDINNSMEILLDLSNLRNLKHLSTVQCVNLKEIRGFDGLESLEKLVFNDCILMERLPVLSNLRNLKHLSTAGCVNLKEIQGFNGLESVEKLNFNDCRSMERLPDLSNLRNLKHLSTAGCLNLNEIQGLNGLESLEKLDINDCISMERLPDLSNLRNLKHLSTAGCINLNEIQGLNGLKSLEILDFNDCRSMERSPDLSNLRNLKYLSKRFKRSWG